MRGRKPKPTHLKVLQGNPGRRPLNKDEPQPEGELHAPPEWMDDKQSAVWRQAIESAPPGLLRHLDEGVLTVWVVAAVMHRDASERVARTGTMVRAPNSGYPMQNPYVAIVNKQAQIMLKAAAEMGFTPSSRSRVTVSGQGKGKKKGIFDDLPSLDTV